MLKLPINQVGLSEGGTPRPITTREQLVTSVNEIHKSARAIHVRLRQCLDKFLDLTVLPECSQPSRDFVSKQSPQDPNGARVARSHSLLVLASIHIQMGLGGREGGREGGGCVCARLCVRSVCARACPYKSVAASLVAAATEQLRRAPRSMPARSGPTADPSSAAGPPSAAACKCVCVRECG